MKIGLLTFEIGMERNDAMQLFEYAQIADELGFSRFWLGEHYDDPLNYWSNPEPLLPLLLGHTERINVGTAGILIRLHSPFRVATNFRLLNSMFMGRVDLGLAGGYAKDPVVEALTGKEVADFLAQDRYQHTQEVISFYRQGLHDRVLGISTC
ncbi:MAG: LLM class flavin-dependent oxidoreductase [Bacteroidota bacterium]